MYAPFPNAVKPGIWPMPWFVSSEPRQLNNRYFKIYNHSHRHSCESRNLFFKFISVANFYLCAALDSCFRRNDGCSLSKRKNLPAEALVKANKEFDMLIFPIQHHGYIGNVNIYFTKKRWNYFVEHLLGATPIWDFQFR